MKSDTDEGKMYSIEQSLIGALLVSPEAMDELQGNLFPSHFANKRFGQAFDAMRALASRDVHISPTSVAKELRNRRQIEGGDCEQYLHDLWGSSATAANAQWCADEIRRDWKRREAAKATAEAHNALKEDGADFNPIVEKLFHKLEDMEKLSQPTGPRSMKPDLESVFTNAGKAAETGVRTCGLSTGFERVDRAISGLQPTNLIVLAGLTGMGKTSFAMNAGVNVSRNGEGVVVIFSMEMSRAELAARVVASEVDLDLRNVITGSLSEQERDRFGDARSGLTEIGGNILLDVSGRVSTTTIRSQLRRIARRHKIALVIVDYLQLCGTAVKAESQYVRTSMISGDLKAIAVDFNVPVLALSQLSRDAARRKGEPLLSDLRDSGTIEQDANVVLFIHRDRRAAEDSTDIAYIIVAKNRNGPTGKFKMLWNPKCVRFSDITDRSQPKLAV